jgi:hypothetical protein
MSEENDQIIKSIGDETTRLLQKHWSDITDFRNGQESIKIGFSIDLEYIGSQRKIECGISFGKRIKDSTVTRFDTEQMDLELNPTGTKRSRKKKTNIIASAIVSGNESGPEVAG